MKKEILWHGRGGQGAFTAARLLGAAASFASGNYYSLAFPSFGPERRGAPLRAFTKYSDKPVQDRSELSRADYLVYLDDTLYKESDLALLKERGFILLNTKRTDIDNERIVAFDAEALALEVINKNLVNTALLGAYAAIDSNIKIVDIEEAIATYMPKGIVEKNKRLASLAYQQVLSLHFKGKPKTELNVESLELKGEREII